MSLTAIELERLKSILIHMAQNIRKILQITEKLIEIDEVEQRNNIWREIEDIASILDRIRREFINEVLVFIARRQPLGRELLSAHALISIAYDVYRISRYCREIARIDSMLAPSSGLNTITNLSKIFREAIKAVEAALDDLIEFLPKRVNIVNEIDIQIDEIYKNTLLGISSNVVISREEAVKALIMRHIERIVDHAKYIEQYLSEVL